MAASNPMAVHAATSISLASVALGDDTAVSDIPANGDAATDETLDGLERAFDREPGHPFRARLEHLVVVHDDQLRRMRRLGISPSIQITWVDTSETDILRRLFDPDQFDLLGRWRDMADDPRLRTIGSTTRRSARGSTFNPRP